MRVHNKEESLNDKSSIRRKMFNCTLETDWLIERLHIGKKSNSNRTVKFKKHDVKPIGELMVV